MKLSFGLKVVALISTVLASTCSFATPISRPYDLLGPCQTSNVTVTSIMAADGSTGNLASGTINSSACIGAFSGIDQPLPHSPNNGAPGDGWVNGAAPFNQNGGGTLVPGLFGRTGWIDLGTGTTSGFSLANPIYGANLSTILSGIFSIAQSSAGVGTWSFNLPANLVPELIQALGIPTIGNSLFDQFALVLKSGDGYAAYDFTASTLGLTVSTDRIYDFSGNWDTSSILCTYHPTTGVCDPNGISGVELYARDPFGTSVDVPEPASIALLGVALVGLGLSRRRKS